VSVPGRRRNGESCDLRLFGFVDDSTSLDSIGELALEQAVLVDVAVDLARLEQIVVRAAMKPISTLMRPLGTIEMKTRESAQAVAERSDVTAVPAMGVIAEAMTAFVVAQAFLEKFGGDSLAETRRNYESYISSLRERKGR